MTDEQLKHAHQKGDAEDIYRQAKDAGDFVQFARTFMHHEDCTVTRNALWGLTKACDKEVEQLQPMLDEWIDLAMHTDSSSVRRLSLHLINRLELNEQNLRADFLDFCLDQMTDLKTLPGVQSLAMKLACKMCLLIPDLTHEFACILENMEMDYYKPAVKSARKWAMMQITRSASSRRTPHDRQFS